MRRLLRHHPATPFLHALCRVACAAAFVAAAVTHARAAGHDPRLRLPAGASVRPGEIVTFRWEPSDSSISELEILLSVDGGRWYTERISPRLDPRTGAYSWRVPNLGVARMRFRIRFNRGGREIEGEPSALLGVLVRPPDPVDLPAAAPGTETEATGETRESGNRDASTPGPGAPYPLGEDQNPTLRVARVFRDRPDRAPDSPSTARPSGGRSRKGDPTPQFVPPRK